MDPIVVGRLRKAHGLDGEILVSPETGDPELVYVPGRVFGLTGSALPGGKRSLTLRTARPHKGGYLLRFAEIGDRERAESLKGHEITVPADTLRPLERGEFFLHELVGFEVVQDDDERVGEVVEVYELGEQVLLGVEVGGQEKLLPLNRELVRVVDREAGRISIDPPPGLLEL
ncbi:MAG: ribosome maturation factor RimM [marine benthic group bacterium]|nr:ribosome maturation factor RimM [Gemmatimonadota bacterium]MCL7956592.1 ribosome maturation factor RimM [Gemmatimonadota bacterium]MCL7969466.1 ribosome maturation factor RimM [Gemmatimonadota bacterium]MCL7974267.1 ribosome maturation factor RimM [Gemmatimonadota bacterium]MCL7976906.1 ribosome maturation factor RimM [Gemmatimonadota bacterium]